MSQQDRTFTDDRYNQDFEIQLKDLLHLTIRNEGTKDFIVSKAIVKPGESFNIPPAGHLGMQSNILKVKFTGSTTAENNAYVTKSYLSTAQNC